MPDVAATPVPAPAPPPAGFAAEEAQLFAPVYPLPRLELARGEGLRVWDAAGNEYLDATSGIAVHALGHCPAGLADAVAAQMRVLGHTSNLFANRPAIELVRALTERTGYARAFLANSGTEANEAALKFARVVAAHRGRPARGLLAFTGSFHGRTGFSVSVTHTPAYRAPFEPLIPGVRFAPFNDVAALDEALTDDIAAVIVEPVQGESGALPATRAFLEALRARTTALGAVLIFDEVQSGMGRTGRLLAAGHFGVRADVTVLSKALGLGFPIGATLVSAEVAAALQPGMHGTTLGGNAIAATAARFALDAIDRPERLAHAAAMGERMRAALEALVAKHSGVAAEHGLGLLRAIELAPDAPFAPPAVLAAAREQRLLLVRAGERSIRVLPPLTVSPSEIDDIVARLDRALEALAQKGASPR